MITTSVIDVLSDGTITDMRLETPELLRVRLKTALLNYKYLI